MAVLWPNGKNYPGDVWHEFGPRAPIWTSNGWTSSFHSGIDIGPWDGTYSTWLLAPVVGTVTHAGYDDIFGNRVVVTAKLDGNQVEFWLCHGRPGSIQVRVGQRVNQRDRLQLMGETGKASGVHIHFEVHVNGTRVDPRAFYNQPHSGGGASTIQEDIMDELIEISGKIYLLTDGAVKHCESPAHVQELQKRTGVPLTKLNGGTRAGQEEWARALDMHGVPRDVLNGAGLVKNPQSGRHEHGALWRWDRAVLAKLK